jgi:hypothetical protein
MIKALTLTLILSLPVNLGDAHISGVAPADIIFVRSETPCLFFCCQEMANLNYLRSARISRRNLTRLANARMRVKKMGRATSVLSASKTK